jgi:hypothetical protein
MLNFKNEKMKKVSVFLGVVLVISNILIGCGENSNKKESTNNKTKESSGESKAGGKWDKLAEINKLTKEDVDKAIEIGTKMSDCYKLESAPGAMDSEMTQACDPFMKEFEDYCLSKFGTKEYSGSSDENKKVEAFREIMFKTRDDLAKAKAK